MNKKNLKQKKYRGRFAPSPSGELHFGSLLAAMASYADARSHNGHWLLRIDDIDLARVVKASDLHIIKTLEQCGFLWDEKIAYQSRYLTHYQQALDKLIAANLCYPSYCSRKQIKALSLKGIYKGTCRDNSFNTFTRSNTLYNTKNYAIRIKVKSKEILFSDIIQANQQQNIAQESGDFIIFRRDQVFSYQLSVVVDDYLSQISHIVRGFDIMDSTARQIYLQQQLDYPTPQYAHIPLAVTDEHLKLSKLSQAKKIDCNIQTLVMAAQFLGQNIMTDKDYDTIDDFWQHLFSIWDINKIPKMEKKAIMY